MAWRHPGNNVSQISYLHSFRPENYCIAGRGFGKTAAACKKAEIAARLFPGITVMITEQTSRDIRDVLEPCWKAIVTPGIYVPKGSGGDAKMIFLNGSEVWFRSRQAKKTSDDPPFRGPTVGMLIHDELALDKREDVLEIGMGMLRQEGMPNCQDVITTPKPNWLYRHLMSMGLTDKILTAADRQQVADDGLSVCFYGKTKHNQYNMDLDAKMRRKLTTGAAEQELDAMWVQLEGRVWEFVEDIWPNGNLIDRPYNPNKPYMIGVDLGGAESAWGLYQKESCHHPRRGIIDVLVLKAEWTPHGRNPWLTIPEIKKFTSESFAWKNPIKIMVGGDYKTPGNTGDKGEHMFVTHGWDSYVETVTGYDGLKDVQHRQAAYIMCNSENIRQFAVSTRLKSFYTDGTRGVMDMFRNDTYPDSGTDYFRKEKSKHGIFHEDSRDQFLYMVMHANPAEYRPQMKWPA